MISKYMGKTWTREFVRDGMQSVMERTICK